LLSRHALLLSGQSLLLLHHSGLLGGMFLRQETFLHFLLLALLQCGGLSLLSGSTHAGLFGSGVGIPLLANLRGNVLRHADEFAHPRWSLNVLFDLRTYHASAGRDGWQLNDCHGSMCLVAFVRTPLLRHLPGMQPLHLTLGNLPVTVMFHLGAGRPALLDKRMPVTAAGHDLRHVHAALENPVLLRHWDTETEVAPAHKHVCIDENIAGRAEAIK